MRGAFVRNRWRFVVELGERSDQLTLDQLDARARACVRDDDYDESEMKLLYLYLEKVS